MKHNKVQWLQNYPGNSWHFSSREEQIAKRDSLDDGGRVAELEHGNGVHGVQSSEMQQETVQEGKCSILFGSYKKTWKMLGLGSEGVWGLTSYRILDHISRTSASSLGYLNAALGIKNNQFCTNSLLNVAYILFKHLPTASQKGI